MTSRARGATVAAAEPQLPPATMAPIQSTASEIAAPEESSAGTPFAEEHEVEGRNAAYEAAPAEEATGDMAPRNEATAEAETQPVSTDLGEGAPVGASAETASAPQAGADEGTHPALASDEATSANTGFPDGGTGENLETRLGLRRSP